MSLDYLIDAPFAKRYCYSGSMGDSSSLLLNNNNTPQTSCLSTLVADCLATITYYLPAQALVSLVMTGDKFLSTKVFRVSTRFHLHTRRLTMAWPSIMSRFYNLKILVLQGSWANQTAVLNVDLYTIPPSLAHLSLSAIRMQFAPTSKEWMDAVLKAGVVAEGAVEMPPSQPQPLLSNVTFAKLLNLVTLDHVVQHDETSTSSANKLINPLPPRRPKYIIDSTIVRMSLVLIPTRGSSETSSQRLTHLHLSETLREDYRFFESYLPPSLVSLLVGDISGLDLSYLTSLQSLVCHVRSTRNPTVLPPNLNDLMLTINDGNVIAASRHCPDLPPTLTKLSLLATSRILVRTFRQLVSDSPPHLSIQSFSLGVLADIETLNVPLEHAFYGTVFAYMPNLTSMREAAFPQVESPLPNSLTALSVKFPPTSEQWQYIPKTCQLKCRIPGDDIKYMTPARLIQIGKETLPHINHLPNVVEGVALELGIPVLPNTHSWDGLRMLHVKLYVSDMPDLLKSIPTTLVALSLDAPTSFLPMRANDFAHLTNLKQLKFDMCAPIPSDNTGANRIDKWVANLPSSLTTLHLDVLGAWSAFHGDGIRECIWPSNMQSLRLFFKRAEVLSMVRLEDVQSCLRSATCLRDFCAAFGQSRFNMEYKSGNGVITQKNNSTIKGDVQLVRT